MLLVVAGALIADAAGRQVATFGGSFVVDDFARFLKVLALIGSASTLILSIEFLSDADRRDRSNTPILILLSTSA